MYTCLHECFLNYGGCIQNVFFLSETHHNVTKTQTISWCCPSNFIMTYDSTIAFLFKCFAHIKKIQCSQKSVHHQNCFLFDRCLVMPVRVISVVCCSSDRCPGQESHRRRRRRTPGRHGQWLHLYHTGRSVLPSGLRYKHRWFLVYSFEILHVYILMK